MILSKLAVLPPDDQMYEFRATSIEDLVTTAMKSSFGVPCYYAQVDRSAPSKRRRGTVYFTVEDARVVLRKLKHGQRLELPKKDGTVETSYLSVDREVVEAARKKILYANRDDGGNAAPAPPRPTAASVAPPQLVRVRLEGLPPADKPEYHFVNEASIAKAMYNTFKVKVDPSGRTCVIYAKATDEKGHRSGHIDVTPDVRDVIVAKLAEGVTLELASGRKNKPKVRRCTLVIMAYAIRHFLFSR
jgi:hypothetical protein